MKSGAQSSCPLMELFVARHAEEFFAVVAPFMTIMELVNLMRCSTRTMDAMCGRIEPMMLSRRRQSAPTHLDRMWGRLRHPEFLPAAFWHVVPDVLPFVLREHILAPPPVACASTVDTWLEFVDWMWGDGAGSAMVHVHAAPLALCAILSERLDFMRLCVLSIEPHQWFMHVEYLSFVAHFFGKVLAIDGLTDLGVPVFQTTATAAMHSEQAPAVWQKLVRANQPIADWLPSSAEWAALSPTFLLDCSVAAHCTPAFEYVLRNTVLHPLRGLLQSLVMGNEPLARLCASHLPFPDEDSPPLDDMSVSYLFGKTHQPHLALDWATVLRVPPVAALTELCSRIATENGKARWLVPCAARAYDTCVAHSSSYEAQALSSCIGFLAAAQSCPEACDLALRVLRDIGRAFSFELAAASLFARRRHLPSGSHLVALFEAAIVTGTSAVDVIRTCLHDATEVTFMKATDGVGLQWLVHRGLGGATEDVALRTLFTSAAMRHPNAGLLRVLGTTWDMRTMLSARFVQSHLLFGRRPLSSSVVEWLYALVPDAWTWSTWCAMIRCYKALPCWDKDRILSTLNDIRPVPERPEGVSKKRKREL